jgi:hypothetical protein
MSFPHFILAHGNKQASVYETGLGRRKAEDGIKVLNIYHLAPPPSGPAS